MKSYFSKQFFAGNRQKLRQLFTGTAPIVVPANGLLQRGGDSSFPFEQDANFWYLTGIDDPDILLVMDRDEEYLIVPARSGSREVFDGSVDYSEIKLRSGIRKVYDDKEGWEYLSERLKKVRHVATLPVPPAYVEHFGLYTNPARASLAGRLKDHRPDIELIDISKQLIHMRMVKQPQELKAMQAAIDVTIDSMGKSLTLNKLSKYKSEFEVEAEISRNFRLSGASGHAYEPIVAGGNNACTLHYVANNDRLSKNDLVLLDVGAQVEHYAADISRTLSLSKPTKRQQAVHAAVLEVQQYALAHLQPGALIKDYELAVEKFMGEKLKELGLIKTINRKNVRKFYPHATSHFLGLNVHDVGDYQQPLEPGMVLTCEPGIYIPAEGIGVRVEDDVLITKKGNKVLSDRLSRSL